MAAPSGAVNRASAKLRIPAPPRWELDRPALRKRLDAIPRHRLTTLIGGAGFGRSTVLASWARGRDVAWYSIDADDQRLMTLVGGVIESLRAARPAAAEALAGLLLHGQGSAAESDEAERARSLAAIICDVLADHPGDAPGEQLVVALDDVDELGDAVPAGRFIEALVRLAPPDVHIVLASRRPLPFPIERLRGQGQLLQIDDEHLAFTSDEVGRVLGEIVGDGGPELASAVHAATDGWPAAVVLVGQALHDTAPSRRAAALRRLQQPEGLLFAYVAGEALAHEPPSATGWLRIAAHFERFSAELLRAVGAPGINEAFARAGKPSAFLQPVAEDPGWYRLHGLVREYLIARLPVSEADLRAVHSRAGPWFEAHGMIDEALQSFAVAGDTEAVGRLLRDRGAVLFERGSVDGIVAAEASLPDDLRGPSERLFGDALLTRGDWSGALAAYVRAGAGSDELDSGLAWRIGLIEYLRGELAQAAQTFKRARMDGASLADDALVLAWSASLSWLHGEPDAARRSAVRSLEIATEAGDDRALAAAHVAMALLANIEGDPQQGEREYRIAREHAERAGDVLQLTRILANLGDHLLERGRYTEALAELDAAVRIAEAVGYVAYQALALADRGQAQLELGHFDEATSDFTASKAIYQRLGSSWVGYAIVREANVLRLRGDLALARAAFEDALRISGATGDRQVIVPAQVGLALTVVREDPDQARELIEACLEPGHGIVPMVALVGDAIVTLQLGDLDGARARADAVIAAALARRDRPSAARALQVRAEARAADDLPGALDDLDQARTIWRECASPTGEAWNVLHRARVLSGTQRLDAAREAEARFTQLGARGWAMVARGLAEQSEAMDRPAVAIESLGSFRVLRNGQPVPITDWQSKKARDLLKLLVARRGRPVPRETLMETLWPDQDPGPLGNRFSVALATLRTVLDPNRTYPPDHFVRADSSVALVPDNVELDFATFMADVEAGRRLEREARGADALERYRAAAARYGGDFLEEDPFEDWAAAPRDEAQAAYLTVIRALATAATQEGDDAAATGYYLRILERDAFDEAAHLGLVQVLVLAGRHGEARRRYAVYQARMDEISVEAAPFPAPVAAAPAGPGVRPGR